jgi:hypothetical protein
VDLVPKSGDTSHIRGYEKNLLWFILIIKKGKIVVMDLLYQEIRRSMVDRQRSLVYAPYIEAFVERVTQKSYTNSVGNAVKRHGTHKTLIDKPIKGVTPNYLMDKSTRDAYFMDDITYDSKRRNEWIILGLRTWYCIYMEDTEKRHKDGVRLRQNNRMLKALIRHHKIDKSTLAGSEEEWSDLEDEGDVFALDNDEVSYSPAEVAAATDDERVRLSDDLGDEDGDDPSI